MNDKIIIRGAREHNLKNIDIEIPRDQLVVITGLSGSGKSSLAFDTIYAEGQRRYVESLSSYARQFLGIMEKPDVDYIEGLSPAISIDQKSAGGGPRSTVGTITEIYDYMRLLWARVGVPFCPNCNKKVARQTIPQIVDQIIEDFRLIIKNSLSGDVHRIMILVSLVKGQKGEHAHIFAKLKKDGFARVRVDGIVSDLSEVPTLDKNKSHNIEVVVDRLTLDKSLMSQEDSEDYAEMKNRLTQSVEIALKLGEGTILIADVDAKEETIYSELFACPSCGLSLPEISPRSFSFNSPYGACPTCTGLGVKLIIDPEQVLPNPRLTIAEGAVRPWSKGLGYNSWYMSILRQVAKNYHFSLDVPVGKLKKENIEKTLYGTSGDTYLVNGYWTTYEGVIPSLERRYKETESDYVKKEIEKYMTKQECVGCKGQRLKPEFLSVKIGNKSISQMSAMSIVEIKDFFENIEKEFSETQKYIARQILKEIKARLSFLENVGLEYLTLDRVGNTLAGGESQRIRLATQIGSGLQGVLYILDEPTIGLHPRDNNRLLSMLKKLKKLGNTIIVVEHDEDTIKSADWILDIGPGAGEHGGEVIASGTLDDIKKSEKSKTGRYLSGKEEIPIPKQRKIGNGKSLEIKGASEFNLKNINVKIPLGKFVCVTGVSGSGKSTLINEILAKRLSCDLHRTKDKPGKHRDIAGIKYLDKVIVIDQSPIGRTPRSNPATYTGVFTPIRELFASTLEARARGYKAGRFSFNVRGGRCEACHGEGLIKIEMQFLPDVYVVCEECKGRRYNREALEITYKGKNIADILNMSAEEALHFFDNIPFIKQKLEILDKVGLSYIKLGQPATTLSGGEAQRIKLSTELARRSTGKTLYILDEPTTGLHFDDVKKLLNVLGELVNRGNTVIVIEHNLHVIKTADWIIDLGPEGGEKGGYVVAAGTPEEIAATARSYTGQYLKKMLKTR
ncbi:MAG: excinuclease ABC subunit UvrA [Candidatus Berkelbacteria bacterium]|nr:excinuclease ABC subunit UvrA [Candidatus Berkelbacteria bacterium]